MILGSVLGSAGALFSTILGLVVWRYKIWVDDLRTRRSNPFAHKIFRKLKVANSSNFKSDYRIEFLEAVDLLIKELEARDIKIKGMNLESIKEVANYASEAILSCTTREKNFFGESIVTPQNMKDNMSPIATKTVELREQVETKAATVEIQVNSTTLD